MLFNSSWVTVLTYLHSQTTLQKAYQAELKVSFSNENNAEEKMKASLKENECYVSRTAAPVEKTR